MLKVTVDDSDEMLVLRCVGRIVSGDEGALLCAAIRHQERILGVDLSMVDAIDAAGIGALVSLQAAGIYLKLLNPSKVVLKVLKVTKMDSVFEICGRPAVTPSPRQLFPHQSYPAGGDSGHQNRGTAAR